MTRSTGKSRARCEWAKGPLHAAYHDEEWGDPVHDDRVLFEFLILEGAQAGLSWDTILKKRETYRTAFAGFDPKKVAAFGKRDVTRLMNDPGIVRNKLKVEPAISSAAAFLAVQKEFGSFDKYIWTFVGGKPLVTRRKTIKDIPAQSDQSDAMSKALKKRGFRFVGSTICYAFMQACGLVSDHTDACYKRVAKKSLPPIFGGTAIGVASGKNLVCTPGPRGMPIPGPCCDWHYRRRGGTSLAMSSGVLVRLCMVLSVLTLWCSQADAASPRAPRLRVSFPMAPGAKTAAHATVAIGKKSVLMKARMPKRMTRNIAPRGESQAASFSHSALNVGGNTISHAQVSLHLLQRDPLRGAEILTLHNGGRSVNLEIRDVDGNATAWIADSMTLGLGPLGEEMAARLDRQPSALSRLTADERQLFDSLVLGAGAAPSQIGDRATWQTAGNETSSISIRRLPPQRTDRSGGDATHGVSQTSTLEMRIGFQQRKLTLGDRTFQLRFNDGTR